MDPADAILTRLYRRGTGTLHAAPDDPEHHVLAPLVAAGLVEMDPATGGPRLTAAGEARAQRLAAGDTRTVTGPRSATLRT
jgi:hypothetical protein